MGKEDFDLFWPGTDVVKSTNNAFSPDHDGPHINWAKDMASAGTSAKITADVERRRKQGKDPGTFHGISRKADDLIARHGGQYTRARARPKVKTENKAGRIREFLRSGPKDSVELGQLMGIKPVLARALMQYDVENGNVVKLRDFRPIRYALAEAR